MKISIIEIKKLKPHEKTDLRKLKLLKQRILADKKIRNPIIVDKNSLTILDGHHRTAAALSLGLRKIPAYMVDYRNPKIKVLPRRTNIAVSKKIVLLRAESGNKMPIKTTRHIIPSRPRSVNIPLKNLS